MSLKDGEGRRRRAFVGGLMRAALGVVRRARLSFGVSYARCPIGVHEESGGGSWRTCWASSFHSSIHASPLPYSGEGRRERPRRGRLTGQQRWRTTTRTCTRARTRRRRSTPTATGMTTRASRPWCCRRSVVFCFLSRGGGLGWGFVPGASFVLTYCLCTTRTSQASLSEGYKIIDSDELRAAMNALVDDIANVLVRWL